MPINTTYPGYQEAMVKVGRVRDFAEGSDAVKAKGEVYLPKLSGQSKDDYDKYKARGYLIPAVSPTAKAIKGSVMRRPVDFEPVGIDYLTDDIDGNKTSIDEFTGNMITELLYAGGVGYLIEYTDKAIVRTYTRENIINFSADYIILSQKYMVQDKDDKYKQTSETEYLELTFDESGNYIQNIWRNDGGDSKYKIIDTPTPTNRETPLKEIPFVFCSTGKSGVADSDPVLLHLANVNHDQYMLSTDQRHGLHWTALPTWVLFGELKDQDGNDVSFKVGPGQFNIVGDTEARIELKEFTGQGLSSIKSAVDDDISTMASIGAKMLSSDVGGVKSAETSRIEASSETATLSILANAIDSTMQEILFIIAQWSGVSEPEFRVNRDFIDIKLDPQALTALLATVNAGKMSINSFLWNLQRGELLPPDTTPEEEESKIDTGPDFALEGE